MIELETDRLLLRQFRPVDIEPVAAFYSDEELARYVGEWRSAWEPNTRTPFN